MKKLLFACLVAIGLSTPWTLFAYPEVPKATLEVIEKRVISKEDARLLLLVYGPFITAEQWTQQEAKRLSLLIIEAMEQLLQLIAQLARFPWTEQHRREIAGMIVDCAITVAQAEKSDELRGDAVIAWMHRIVGHPTFIALIKSLNSNRYGALQEFCSVFRQILGNMSNAAAPERIARAGLLPQGLTMLQLLTAARQVVNKRDILGELPWSTKFPMAEFLVYCRSIIDGMKAYNQLEQYAKESDDYKVQLQRVKEWYKESQQKEREFGQLLQQFAQENVGLIMQAIVSEIDRTDLQS